MNWWDDGKIDNFAVGDKDADLASRFAITGSATIAPGWSGGFNITVVAPGGGPTPGGNGGVFGITSNQEQDTDALLDGTIRTLYSYIYIKSDNYGTLNWGYLSPASDNPAVLADISGTVIESNAVFFEGGGFFVRPKGTGLNKWESLDQQVRFLDFTTCYTGGGVGADCFGAPRPAVRYDSPTWGGFRFETSYGTVQDTGIASPDSNFWDIAVFYTADWNSIKISAAYAFTWTEGNASPGLNVSDGNCTGNTSLDGGTKVTDCGEATLNQVGASIMHKPSGLGIYGLYQHEEVGGHYTFEAAGNILTFGLPDTNVWYVKPFWRKAWSPIGATVLYGEYGQYNDQYGGLLNNIASTDFENTLPACAFPNTFDCRVSGSEVQRWGLGVVQEIDAAAMHVFARWQHQTLDVDFTGYGGFTGCPDSGCKVKQSFDDWDLFQVGGIIFF
jgi:hypothetical protein